MARVIKFEGRRIVVPDDATPEEIQQIIDGPSAAAPAAVPVASDLPTPGTLRADGGVVPNTEQMAVAPAAPSTPYDRYRSSDNLVDSIMAGADYVDDTGAIIADRMGEGAANLVGLPVDLINNAPVLANLVPGVDGVQPLSPNPVGGSESFNQLRKGFGLIPDAPEPTDPLQVVAGRVGEEIGASAIPGAGIINQARRMGVNAVRESSPLVRMFLEQAAVNPAKFVGNEVAGATAAGTGAGIANLLVDRETPEGQVADLTGAVSGVGVAGIGKGVGGGLLNIFNALRNDPGYVDDVVVEAVVDRLARAAGVEGTAATGGAPDTSQLVDTIMRGQTTSPVEAPVESLTIGGRVFAGGRENALKNAVAAFGADSPEIAEFVKADFERRLRSPESAAATTDVGGIASIIPGFKESIADRTANPGLAALEYSRQSGPNAPMFSSQRNTNAQVVDRALSELQPTETPGAFRQELSDVRDLRLSAAAGDTNAAQNEFERYIQTLVPQADAEGRGAAIRDGLTNAERAARETESELWRAITGEVDPAPLADNLEGARGGLTEARRMSVSDMDPVVDIPRRLADPGDVPEGEVAPPTLVDLQELVDMRSSLLTEQRNAASTGDTNRSEAIGRYIEEVNAYIDSDAVPAETRAQLDLARGVSRDVNERFNRPNDPIADVLATREGRPNVPDSAVGGKFVQPNERQASNIDRLLAETDLTSRATQVRDALKDEIVAGIDKNAMAGDPARLDQYLNQFSRVFDRFPDLREEIGRAAEAGRGFDTAREAEVALQRELGTPDGSVKGSGAVGRYLDYSDGNSERAIGEVLASKDPAAAADELLTFIGDNPRAVEGARAAFWQKLKTESQSVDNAQRGTDGNRAWRGDWLKSFLNKPTNAAVAERLYRDNPQHLADVRRIANVLDSVDLRQRGKAPGTSGTAQGVNPVISVETLQSRGYAYMRGQVSGTYLATSIAAVIARRAVRKAQTSAIETLTDKALLNPDFAAEILKDNNPANRKALARKAKLWLGNQASTLVNLLDDEEGDE